MQLLAVVLFLTVAPAHASGDAGSLYARIGGEQKMQAIVDQFADAIWTDPQIAHFYEGVTRSRFKKLLAQQFCRLSGGGCIYEGEGMRDVHAGLGIGQSDFYRLVEILRVTLERQQVRLRERNEMLALLAPMKRDVVDPR